MTILYSKTTGGFYDPIIHGSNIPADCVEITTELHQALLIGQDFGKVISSNEDGFPILADAPGPTKDQIWSAIKTKRDDHLQNGGFRVGTKWFHSDTFSRSQQIGLVLLGANIPETLQWKTMDGTFVPMTQTLAQQIFASAAASDAAVFAAAEIHKAAMEASSNWGSYDFSAGWPDRFEG
jgi:hypothetical protein